MKIWKYYVIFDYILEGKMGKTGKNLERKSRNCSGQNTKDQNMGRMKHYVLFFCKSCHFENFMFSKKATKFDKIFTVDLTLTT